MLKDAALPAPALAVVARATTQGRLADAYLHEIRGSFQALVGAFELLCRVAKGSGADSGRADKACELARRAIRQHEKTTLDMFHLLTFQSAEISELDLRALAEELVRLFRNDVATRDLSMQVSGPSRPWVRADRGGLHAAVATLLWIAIDSSAAGTELRVHVDETDGRAVLTIEPASGTPIGGPPFAATGETLLGAVREYLSAGGGGLRLESAECPGRRILQMFLPAAVPARQPTGA